MKQLPSIQALSLKVQCRTRNSSTHTYTKRNILEAMRDMIKDKIISFVNCISLYVEKQHHYALRRREQQTCAWSLF